MLRLSSSTSSSSGGFGEVVRVGIWMILALAVMDAVIGAVIGALLSLTTHRRICRDGDRLV